MIARSRLYLPLFRLSVSCRCLLSTQRKIKPNAQELELQKAAKGTIRDKLSYPEDQVARTDDGIEFMKYFNDFLVPDFSDIYNVRSGSYVKVTEEDIKKYLPEGVSKYMADEFELTGYNLWMIRDSTKLLCKLVDNIEKTLVKRGQQTNNSTEALSLKEESSVLHAKVTVPGFTDKKEWDECKLNCSHFGESLLGKEVADDPLFEKALGPGSTLDVLSQNMKNKKIDRIFLTGDRGVGKSVIMDQMVMHARKNGWLTMYINNGWDQVHSGLYIEPLKKHQGLFDNTLMTKTVLRGFWKAHREQLAALPITRLEETNKYRRRIQKFNEKWKLAQAAHDADKMSFVQIRRVVWEEDVPEEEDELDHEVLQGFNMEKVELKTLADLILIGVAIPRYTGWVWQDLMKELKKIDDIPILFAIDQYNSWFHPSAYYYNEESVDPFEINVPSSFYVFDYKKEFNANPATFPFPNALCVASTSYTHPEGAKTTFKDMVSSFPLHVTVPNYNQTEYLSAFSYYVNHSVIEPSFNKDDFLLFRTFCRSNPYQMSSEALDYFLPKLVSANYENFQKAVFAQLISDKGQSQSRSAEISDGRETTAPVTEGKENVDDADEEEDFVKNKGNQRKKPKSSKGKR